MDKILFIEEYIKRCNNAVDENDSKGAKLLSNEIIGVFGSEISDITAKLDSYIWHTNGIVDYIGDIKILRQKLINYQANLQTEKEKILYNLELARLQQPSVTAHAESNQNQNISVDVNVTIEQILKQVDEIPKEKLEEEEKERLKEHLYFLEGIKATKDKSKFWEKAREVLKFLADKGVDVAIAILPYIIQGLTQ